MTLLSSRQQQRGSVVLVALCFLAVLGIALASYLAVSHQAVKLSNREYQRSISLQLAESGIEQSLWSFNWNNWDPTAWTIDTTNHWAKQTVTFLNTKYGNGVVGSIMLRVDRWDATVWNNFTAYSAATHDMVWYQGVWYQCITDDSSYAPPTDSPSGKWRGAPAQWNASANYQSGNLVLYNGKIYQSWSPSINTPPILANIPTYWVAPPAATPGNWNSSTNYGPSNIVLFGGMSYRCIVANSNQQPPNATYWVGSPAIYAEGIATPPDNPAGTIRTQLRALLSPATLFANAIGASSTVSLTPGVPNGFVDSYNFLLGTYPSPGPNTNPQTGYSATIAGGSTSGTAVTMSGGTVQGYINAPSTLTAPFPPNLSLAGILKGVAAGTGIDPERINRSPNVPQFDPTKWDSRKTYRPYDVARAPNGYLYICSTTHVNQQPPAAYWSDGGPGTPGSGTPTIGIAGSLYPLLYHVNGDLNLSTTSDVLTIDGPVILDVRGNIVIAAGEIIVTANGSAEILFSGQLHVYNSTGGIDNTTHDPRRLLLASVSSSPTITTGHYFDSPIKFYGAIYMPQCSLSIDLTVGGSAIFGAISAGQVSTLDRLRVHYDTSLRTATFPGIDSPFTVTEWRELTDPAEKIILQ